MSRTQLIAAREQIAHQINAEETSASGDQPAHGMSQLGNMKWIISLRRHRRSALKGFGLPSLRKTGVLCIDMKNSQLTISRGEWAGGRQIAYLCSDPLSSVGIDPEQKIGRAPSGNSGNKRYQPDQAEPPKSVVEHEH